MTLEKSSMILSGGGSIKSADLSTAPGPPSSPMFVYRLDGYLLVFLSNGEGIMSFKINGDHQASFGYQGAGEPTGIELSSNPNHITLQKNSQ